MSFPDIQVLSRFLDDYIEIRSPTWHSLSTSLAKGASQLWSAGSKAFSGLAATVFTSSRSKTDDEEKSQPESDEKRITKVCKDLKTIFSQAKTLNAWIAVVRTLGNQARSEHSRDKNSIFCQTLHAMRSYAVQDLQQLPEFKDALAALWKEYETKEAQLLKEEDGNLPVAPLEAELNGILYGLADLEDLTALSRCRRFRLFRTLEFPDKNLNLLHQLDYSRVLINPKVNINRPLYYRKDYFIAYYSKWIYPIKKQNLEAFKLRAKNKGKLIVTGDDAELAAQLVAQAGLVNVDDAAVSLESSPNAKLTPLGPVNGGAPRHQSSTSVPASIRPLSGSASIASHLERSQPQTSSAGALPSLDLAGGESKKNNEGEPQPSADKDLAPVITHVVRSVVTPPGLGSINMWTGVAAVAPGPGVSELPPRHPPTQPQASPLAAPR